MRRNDTRQSEMETVNTDRKITTQVFADQSARGLISAIEILFAFFSAFFTILLCVPVKEVYLLDTLPLLLPLFHTSDSCSA